MKLKTEVPPRGNEDQSLFRMSDVWDPWCRVCHSHTQNSKPIGDWPTYQSLHQTIIRIFNER